MSESDSPADIEATRSALRAAVDARTGETVAEESGISRDTVYRFLRGHDVSPRTRQRLSEYARRLSESDGERGPALPGTAAGSLPAVSIPLHELTYWRGVIETEHRHLAGLNQSMEALLRMLRDATQGIGGFIASGVLPAPTPTVEESRARIRARSEEFAREQEAPEAKRA